MSRESYSFTSGAVLPADLAKLADRHADATLLDVRAPAELNRLTCSGAATFHSTQSPSMSRNWPR